MWFCPTFQRPQRLAELALSWERHEAGTELYVRVWRNDPKLSEYFSYDWPDGWHLSVTDHEWTAEALNGFYDWNPNQEFYGFIADDIILRTPGGLKILEEEAKDWYISYPNDGYWGYRLPTHFCVGGELARTLGFWVPRQFSHNGIDSALANIGMNCGLLRYCPEVVFHHKHFLMYPEIERDATYRRIYTDEWLAQRAKSEVWNDPDARILESWQKSDMEACVMKVRQKLACLYEDRERWDFEDAQMKELGIEASRV